MGAAAVVFAGLAGAVAARGPFFFMSCDPDEYEARIDATSYVYAADGSLLATIGQGREHRPVDIEAVSPWLRQATVAVEDRRFYDHAGLDYLGIARALFADVEEGEIVQGGSTITQQLARNLYLGHERSFRRKLAEGCLAVALEREWSKDRILETYLNTVYYGNGAYGAEAAARTYFSKTARRLSPEQAALLAGLPRSPSRLDPFSRKGPALESRNGALRALVETGAISEGRFERSRRAPLGLRPSRGARDRSLVNLVLDELSGRYGPASVRRGGFRIHTSIDPRLQRLARDAIRETLDRRDDPAAAIVAIDPENGAIRAMVSEVPGRNDQFFNLAAYGSRQPGSAFKTFVLVESIRRGINPSSTYLSAPFEGPPANGRPWNVETYDRTYAGRIPIGLATLRSDNTVYARLTLDLEPRRVVETARAMGLRSELPPVPSVGLGTAGVSVLELASAYATLASSGMHMRPFVIRSVVLPGGREDAAGWGAEKPERALPDAVASHVTRILERNIEAGTGTQAAIGRPAAGKTGTTDDFADAWFAGYTPELATVVWVGRPGGRVPMEDVHGIAVAGGTFPAAIWQRFMAPALERSPVTDWPEPGDAIEWKRFCGRYQYARSYRDAPAEARCPEPTTRKTTARAERTATREAATAAETTQPPTPPRPPTTTQETGPPPPDEGLVGRRGTVTQEIDNEAGTGEVELRGRRWPARSETGEPLALETPVEAVRVDDQFVYVEPVPEGAG